MVQAVKEATPQSIDVKRRLSSPLRALDDLSWNYWWSWAADGVAVFRDLDPEMWEQCEHNPRRLLRETSEVRLTQMASDPGYNYRVRELGEKFDRYINDSSSLEENGITWQHPVAYFARNMACIIRCRFIRAGLECWRAIT
jgi:glucan phosphorylase